MLVYGKHSIGFLPRRLPILLPTIFYSPQLCTSYPRQLFVSLLLPSLFFYLIDNMSKRKRMRDSLSEDALVSAERASCELHLKFNVVALEEQ